MVRISLGAVKRIQPPPSTKGSHQRITDEEEE
jgi:hypothetical protein